MRSVVAGQGFLEDLLLFQQAARLRLRVLLYKMVQVWSLRGVGCKEVGEGLVENKGARQGGEEWEVLLCVRGGRASMLVASASPPETLSHRKH